MQSDENMQAEPNQEQERVNAEDTQQPEEKVEAAEVQDELAEAKAQKEQEDFKSKYFYLAAEMQNLQKRFDKEKEQIRKYGSEKILQDLLDVVDNFERTLSFIRGDEDQKIKNIVVGIEMINKQFLESLEKHGLKQIKALGEIFDPHLHEALAQQEDSSKKNMEIIQVHQVGYTLNDRLLRPAKVVVARNDNEN